MARGDGQGQCELVIRRSELVSMSFQTFFDVIPNPFRGHSKPVSRSFRTCFGISTTQGQSTPTRAPSYHTCHPDPKQVQGRNLLQESTYQNEQEADSPAFLWHDKWHWQSRAASRRCLFPPHPLFLAR